MGQILLSKQTDSSDSKLQRDFAMYLVFTQVVLEKGLWNEFVIV